MNLLTVAVFVPLAFYLVVRKDFCRKHPKPSKLLIYSLLALLIPQLMSGLLTIYLSQNANMEIFARIYGILSVVTSGLTLVSFALMLATVLSLASENKTTAPS